jgi:DNA-binding response OmpR family regulator
MADESNHPAVVLIINTSPDTVDLLKDVFEQAGFLVVSTFTWAIQNGTADVESILRVHRPTVVVYDIAPPYERNWAFFVHLRDGLLKAVRFVLTSANVAHVEALVGRDERIYEVVGKPHDLDVIVRATKEAARARPTR